MSNKEKEPKKNSIWLEHALKTISGILTVIVIAFILNRMEITTAGAPIEKKGPNESEVKPNPNKTEESEINESGGTKSQNSPIVRNKKPDETLELRGIILDYENNNVVNGAKVIFGDKIMTTNSDGTFKFSTTSKEGKKIRIIKEGYAEYTDYITPPTDNLTIKIRKK